MKKKTIIDIAAFVIPAILAYSQCSYMDVADGIGYAIAIGLTFCLPIGAIATGTDPEYRKKATTAEKISLLLTIVAFPILYLTVSNYYSHYEQYPGKTVTAWASFIIALAITFVVGKAITYVIKLFGKE